MARAELAPFGREAFRRNGGSPTFGARESRIRRPADAATRPAGTAMRPADARGFWGARRGAREMAECAMMTDACVGWAWALGAAGEGAPSRN